MTPGRRRPTSGSRRTLPRAGVRPPGRARWAAAARPRFESYCLGRHARLPRIVCRRLELVGEPEGVPGVPELGEAAFLEAVDHDALVRNDPAIRRQPCQ